ncbi:hypothetical protein AURDEDRAFT_113780 [Auricularia subglabra TFB-10046 SS5]|nr:hypothetical protein AURDEDRAFT_113780 [Auricularia subglabra TFB-10046 SS5]
MGIRTALIVGTTSFFLGALTTNWIADSLTLWKSPATEAGLRTAAEYYALLSKMPEPMLWALYGVIGLAFAALGASAWQGASFNIMFDGASIVLAGSAAYYYLNEVLPNMSLFSSRQLTDFALPKPFPAVIRKATLDLASAHLVCAVALTGVIVLQAGRLWVEGEQAAEDESERASTQATEELNTDSASNVAPRRHHAPEEAAPARSPSSIRKKGSVAKRASSRRSER